MDRGRRLAFTGAACALALVAAWLLLAALVDAKHPENIVVNVPAISTSAASVSWWAVGTSLAWRAAFALVVAVAAAWIASSGEAPTRWLRVALILMGVTAAALALVGATGAGAMIGDHSALSQPATPTATAAFDVVAGLTLMAGVFGILYPPVSKRAEEHRSDLLRPSVAWMLLFVIAGGAVGGIAEAAGGPARVTPSAAQLTVSVATQPPERGSFVPQPSAPDDGGVTGDYTPPLADSLAVQLPHGVAEFVPGCQDESENVFGTHTPRACTSEAYVTFRPAAGASGQVFVDSYASVRELISQYDVELRYMRQYAGRRTDTRVRGIANARMIHTGEQGDLFAVVARVGARLVIEFVSSADGHPLRARAISAAVKDARRVVTTVRTY